MVVVVLGGSVPAGRRVLGGSLAGRRSFGSGGSFCCRAGLIAVYFATRSPVCDVVFQTACRFLDIHPAICLRRRIAHRRRGRVCETVGRRLRSARRSARVAESDSLLMSCLGKPGPRVQIPASPPAKTMRERLERSGRVVVAHNKRS